MMLLFAEGYSNLWTVKLMYIVNSERVRSLGLT